MKKYPNVSLKIILRYKNKILLLRLPDGRTDFPGGRMEWEESIFGALKRELKEEINYDLKEESELFQVWNYISKNKKRHSVMINFIYKLDKKPKLSSHEKAEILWVTKKEIISKNIIKDKNFVEKIFSWRSSKHGSKKIAKEKRN
jgi:8-oxo-dGTP pyrophosphatase MutT (NUDIX family)